MNTYIKNIKYRRISPGLFCCLCQVLLTCLVFLPFPAWGQVFSLLQDDPVVTDTGSSRGSAWGDFDGDGFEDLFVSNAQGLNNALFRNQYIAVCGEKGFYMGSYRYQRYNTT